MDLLRIVTAGSVDDGKSTLIGRLLYDSKQVFDDTLASLERASAAQGLDDVNLALLTDGLRAEREQGITIDVAYRYFATPKRKFIIADSPGHVQYTRNMVTGASTADIALILVDARKGVIEQTRRHTAITNLLGIQRLVLCVNKMDLVEWSKDIFDAIEAEYRALAATLGVPAVTVIPMAAVSGANIVEPSCHTPWYSGPPLLAFLEDVAVPNPSRHRGLRFPVQFVIRPQSDEFHDYRGYAGTVAAGHVSVGAAVTVLPLGVTTTVTAIDRFEESLTQASHGDAVTIRLADDLDVGRGSMLAPAGDLGPVTNRFTADICWMSDTSVLRPGNRYWVKHTTRRVRCIVESLDSLFNVQTLGHLASPDGVGLNDIARITIRTTEALFLDPYSASRDTGSFILIDASTRRTVAAGMIRDINPAVAGDSDF